MRRGFALFLAALFVAALPVAGQAQQAPAAAPKITITPYGFVLFSTHFNDGNFAAQDFPAQVNAGPGNGSFLMTARGSRFGFKIGVPDDPFTGAKVSAVIEMDFKSGTLSGTNSTAWPNAIPRLRLAYAQASWGGPDSKFTLLAGQDWGVFAPVMGTSLAFGADPIFAQAGNLWRRAPQIKASYDMGMGALGFNVQLAALNDQTNTNGINGTDLGAGNATRLPQVEARVAVLYKQGAKKVAEVGVSGHYDWRRYVVAAQNRNVDVNGRAAAVDAQFNVPFVTLQGEAFMNDGAADSLNGMTAGAANGSQFTVPSAANNGVNLETQGFWAQAVLKPIPQVQIPVGYGVEQIRYKNIGFPGANRTANSVIHAGLLFNMTNPWKFGVEYVRTITQYQAGLPAGGYGDQVGQKALTADSFVLTSKLDF